MKSFSRLIFFFYILNLLFLISHHECSKKMKTTNIDKCKNFNLGLNDFKLDSFTGVWYPISKSSNLPVFTNCDKITFTKSNGQLTGEIANRKKRNSNDNLSLNLSNTANLNSFSFSYIGIKNVLTVIDTDYQNWAILYACTDLFFSKMYNVVVMSRSISLPQAKLDELNEIIKTKIDVKSNKIILQGADTCPSN